MKTIIIDGVEYNLTPKALFKKGDWIVYCNEDVDQITGIEDNGYLINKGGYIPFTCQGDMRLWTIQDAKDGDVLYHKSPFGIEYIVMSRGVNGYGNVDSYFRYNSVDGFDINIPSVLSAKLKDITPATKEQRDLLFSKMEKAGYEWDNEKKKLKKIEQKPEINDDVLSRFAFYQYDDEILYLSSVFVEERSRKRGYGSKILKAAEEVAKTLGISKIRLKVERNTWMEEWYKKNGYEYLSSEGKYDWLEKRVEQKLAWSEEDEKILNEFIESLRYHNGKGYDKQINWLKSLKERMKGE